MFKLTAQPFPKKKQKDESKKIDKDSKKSLGNTKKKKPPWKLPSMTIWTIPMKWNLTRQNKKESEKIMKF